MNGIKEAMDFFGLQEGTIVTLNQSDLFVENGKQIRAVASNDWFIEISKKSII